MKEFFRRQVLFLACMMVVCATYGQSTITGTLSDDENKPLIGARVTVFGTSTTTITDSKGFYSLPVTSYPVKLKILYQGFTTTAVFEGNAPKSDKEQSEAGDKKGEVQTVNSTLLPSGSRARTGSSSYGTTNSKVPLKQ